MKRIALFLLAISAWSQTGTSVSQRVVAAGSTAPPFVTINVNNVGQAGHQAVVTFTNAPSHTCSNPSSIVLFEGSSDGSTYSPFGMNSSVAGGSSTTLISFILAQGVFRYVHIKVQAYDNTDCRITIDYAGSIQQSPIVQAQGAVPATYQGAGGLAKSVNPLLVGGIGGVGGNMIPMAACLTSVPISVTAGTTSALVSNAGTDSVYVCSFALSASAASTTAQFVQGTGTNCGTGTLNLSGAFAMTTASNVALGNGTGVVMAGSTGKDLCLTAVTGNVTGILSYATF